jgi:hypothetical protein
MSAFKQFSGQAKDTNFEPVWYEVNHSPDLNVAFQAQGDVELKEVRHLDRAVDGEALRRVL